MHTLADTFWGFREAPDLVPDLDSASQQREAPLVSIWIDPALTAFQSSARLARTANSLEEQEKDSTDRFDAEDLNSILPHCN